MLLQLQPVRSFRSIGCGSVSSLARRMSFSYRYLERYLELWARITSILGSPPARARSCAHEYKWKRRRLFGPPPCRVGTGLAAKEPSRLQAQDTSRHLSRHLSRHEPRRGAVDELLAQPSFRRVRPCLGLVSPGSIIILPVLLCVPLPVPSPHSSCGCPTIPLGDPRPL